MSRYGSASRATSTEAATSDSGVRKTSRRKRNNAPKRTMKSAAPSGKAGTMLVCPVTSPTSATGRLAHSPHEATPGMSRKPSREWR